VSDPVVALAALAEEELDLVAAGRIEALPELHERRQVALDALPAHLSPSERETLIHVHQMQEQVASLLQLAVNETAAQLGRIERGSAALKGYANTLKSI
jgi:Trp operon repressor